MLLERGYAEIGNVSSFELGKKLLQMALDRRASIDYEKVLNHSYGPILSALEHPGSPTGKEGVSRLTYAFDLIQFVRHLGNPLGLGSFWYLKEKGHEFGGYIVLSGKQPKREAIRLDIHLAHQLFFKGFQKHAFYIGNEDAIVNMLNKGKQIGLEMRPEDIVNCGYNKLLQGYDAEHGFSLIKIGEALGASIPPPIQRLVRNYQELKPQQQPKA